MVVEYSRGLAGRIISCSKLQAKRRFRSRNELFPALDEPTAKNIEAQARQETQMSATVAIFGTTNYKNLNQPLMQLLQRYAFMALLFFCQTVQAQEQNTAAASNQTYIIPFRLTAYNNIAVEAILNKTDTVHLMFHTAANDVTLTEEAARQLRTLRFEEADTVKSWGGGGNISRHSKGNLLQIGDLQWNNLSIWENKNSGQQTDGKIGIGLFENKVVQIDFDKKILIIGSSLPRNIKKYEKCKLTFRDDNMFVEAGCATGDTVIQHHFLIHTGYAGAVLFDDQFAGEHKLGEKLQIVGEKELRDSYGHVLKTKKAVLPAFKIGDTRLSNVPAGFFEGAIGRQKMSIIGGDVLKRFNIIIDAKREYVYFKTNSLKKTPHTNA